MVSTSLTAELVPRFAVSWHPEPPTRLCDADFKLFDVFRARAMAELRGEVKADRR